MTPHYGDCEKIIQQYQTTCYRQSSMVELNTH